MGILAGLILVGVQINQNSDLTRAALFSQYQDSWVSLDQSLQSENFAATKAKVLDTPNELTTAEMLEMHGYMFTFVDQLHRVDGLQKMGVFPADFRQSLVAAIQDGFGNSYARAWWEVTKGGAAPEVVFLVDEVLAQMSANSDLDNIRQIREKIASQGT